MWPEKITPIELSFFSKDYKLAIYQSQYRLGWTFLGLVDLEDGEPFTDITVYLGPTWWTDYVYLDVNNFSMVEDIFKDLNLWTPTGEQVQSGFVTYPKYKLNWDEIKKHLLPINQIDD